MSAALAAFILFCMFALTIVVVFISGKWIDKPKNHDKNIISMIEAHKKLSQNINEELKNASWWTRRKVRKYMKETSV